MKILHTADWHLGKKLEGYSRLHEQEETLKQLRKIALEEQVSAIVIAGDIYDQSIPSIEAIRLYKETLQQLNLEDGFPILAISGNHDSAERLAEGKKWYEQTQFYLATTLEEAFQPIRLGNVQFFLLPFMHPHAIRRYFQDETLTNIQEGMKRIVAKMEQQFADDCYHVLVTHFFVEGSQRTDSETTSTVGGLDNIHQGIFQSFDYVALGHLHSSTAIQQGKARYSGSLLKYSLSEKNQTKGAYIIDFADEMSITFHPFDVIRDVTEIKGTMDELMTSSAYIEAEKQYVGIKVEDKESILNMAQRLKSRYPYLLTIERCFRPSETVEMKTPSFQEWDVLEMAKRYYQKVMDENLSAEQEHWLKTVQEERAMEDESCDH